MLLHFYWTCDLTLFFYEIIIQVGLAKNAFFDDELCLTSFCQVCKVLFTASVISYSHECETEGQTDTYFFFRF